MEDLERNPFAALFPSLRQAVEFASEKCRESVSNTIGEQHNLSNASSNSAIDSLSKITQINSIIQDVFLITLDPDSSSEQCLPCVYLKDFKSSYTDSRDYLDVNLLPGAVFERLMLAEPSKYVITPKRKPSRNNLDDAAAAQSSIIYYLFECYKRWTTLQQKRNADTENVLSECKRTIINYSEMAMKYSIIFPNRQSLNEFLDLLLEYREDTALFLFVNDVVESIEISNDESGENSVLETFTPIMSLISARFVNATLTDPNTFNNIQLLNVFQCRASLALTFITCITPEDALNGKAYEKTLLGCILKMSTIPESEQGPYEYFENPLTSNQREYENMEQILWTPLNKLSTEIYRVLHSMLLRFSPAIKHEILTWIGNCLQANSGRAKLWHSHMSGLLNFNHVADGFMLNLSSVLLRLCRPFSFPNSQKLTLIDPTYCAATLESDEESEKRGIHLKGGLVQETCLISASDVTQRPQSESYKFATECFFMTHRCLQIGFRVLHEKIVKLVTELRRLQRLYSEAVQQAAGSTDVVENLKTAVERGTTMYLCTRAHMMEPEMLEMMLNFHIATAMWLVQVTINSDSIYPIPFQPVSFPLPENVPSSMACVPEFIIDNVADFMTFLLRFSPRTLEMAGESLEHLMTMILVFMGSPERIKNPHLRAKLAEALDSLMPHPEENMNKGLGSSFHREQLFTNHPHINQLAEVLLHVFVSIEMTGQSVAFEQKFNYRRPMYEVLAYIWKLEIHRAAIKKLARDAEDDINCASPPLFLRFINLLINDAIYLLDEGLLHMTSLREHQQRRETEAFRNLTPQQRQDSETNFRHTGMLARFHNVMGKQTINTLQFLTSEVVSIFVHPTMVERIAAMLNYFLLHLVGPKNRALKVRDMDEYEFKPQDLVTGICEIYINLGRSSAFWEAVATDGRSYSSELFRKAEDVLFKIGKGGLVPDFQKVANNVKVTADSLKIREEALVDAPDEYLDPIMGTLMQDPVILPSSKVIVDRSTIARHILSDQTDPFNRSPLTMDMVQSATDLKIQIDKWLAQSQQKQR